MAANTDGGDESDALDALLNDSLNDYDRRQAAAEAAAVRPCLTEPPRVLSSTEEKDEEEGEADHLADALADEFLSSLSGYENGEDVEVLTEQLMAQLGVSKEEMLQARQREEAVAAAADAEDAGETAQARNVKEKGGAQGQRQAGGKAPRDMEAQMAAMLEQLAAVAEKSKKESASGETTADGAGDREAEALLNSLLSGLGDEDGLLGGGEGDDSDDGDSGEEGDDILATMLDAVFSKEMLYPSLSELRDRYPPWLAEQGDALSPADQQRFKAQHSNITAICRLYEASDRPDSKAVLDLINRMNSLGSPPEPIVKNMGIELGPDGTPQLPNLGGAQCSLM